MDTKATKHCRYNINYHLVICPKYRRDVLSGNVGVFLEDTLKDICSHYKYDLLNVEVMPDHVHLFVSASPYTAPTEIIKTLKSISTNRVFQKYPQLKARRFRQAGLWSKGYFVGTAGTVTAKTIQKYIEEQKSK